MSLWCENCEERGEWFEHSNDVLVAERDALRARLAEAERDLAQANRRIVAMGEMDNALKTRLEAADLTIKAANDALHGYGMADQKMAWDTACEILDSYSTASQPSPAHVHTFTMGVCACGERSDAYLYY